MDRVVLTLVADSLLVRKQKGCLGEAIARLVRETGNNSIGNACQDGCVKESFVEAFRLSGGDGAVLLRLSVGGVD